MGCSVVSIPWAVFSWSSLWADPVVIVLQDLHTFLSCTSLLCAARDCALLVLYSQVVSLQDRLRIGCSTDEWSFNVLIELYSVPHVPQAKPVFFIF